MTELAIKWPDPLLVEAGQAAKATTQGLECYLLQAALERIQMFIFVYWRRWNET